MKRQTVTLTRRFLDLLGELNNNDRLYAYDEIFSHLFNGKPIETNGQSDALRIALACLGPELRKAQSQYENGIISKKLTINSQELLCPNDGSQTRADNMPKNSPIDNNIYNNKNMFLTINQSNHQHGKTELCSFNAITDGNVQSYSHALEKILKQLQPINAMVSLRTAEVFSKIIKSKSIKIKDEFLDPANVLKQIFENIRQVEANELVCILEELFDDIDSRKITNKTKYEIMSLFKIHTRLKKKPKQKKKEDFVQRNYSEMDFENVFDKIDDADI